MVGSLQSINGVPIYLSPYLTDRVIDKMCRSKKKRQVRKWLKNDKHYKSVPSKKVLMMKDRIIIHPNIKETFLNALENR